MPMRYDVFISHASEDKEDFVRPLVDKLRDQHVEVWYDEISMEVGHSLMQSINTGLAQSAFAVVVLSPHFFNKVWTKNELNGVFARQIHENRQIVLPVWHNVTKDDVIQHLPILADIVALNSSDGVEGVVAKLMKKLRPTESPLTIAREILIGYGLEPPVVSDEIWLELAERLNDFDDEPLWRRWIFPLPHDVGASGKKRGANIASLFLQTAWLHELGDRDYCQITNPEKLHEFLRASPGLVEIARQNPDLLALYAPQLTVPGFDTGFEDVFDKLLTSGGGHSDGHWNHPGTIDEKPPLCGELISWRHPTFGNYAPAAIARDFAKAQLSGNIRSPFGCFECLVWLLSSDSRWLPEKHREILIEGMREEDLWAEGDWLHGSELLDSEPGDYEFTETERKCFLGGIERALAKLKISDKPEAILDKILDLDLIGSMFDHLQEALDSWRKNGL